MNLRGRSEIERCVGQTEAKLRSRLDLACVIPTMADVQPIAIEEIVLIAWNIEECWSILHPEGESHRQSTAGVDDPAENISEGRTELLTWIPGNEGCRYIIEPRQVDRAACVDDHDCSGICSSYPLDEFILTPRKPEHRAIMTLGFPVRIQANNNDSCIGL